ncbi:YopX family protein [Campylobacter helveticus]|uniref:YopX family protein n=1 Tax=Campylobacter helveticus TaxID=28898 RepID=UPI0014874019|nr:YopX family protein [Campylobacter helveticus]
MRLIDLKFRIWDNDNKLFVYGNMAENELLKNYDRLTQIELHTGFDDKNRKSIYEGDNIKYREVKYHYNSWQLLKIENDFIVENMLDFYFHQCYLDNRDYCEGYERLETLEVIGNIHENEKLLNAEQDATNTYASRIGKDDEYGRALIINN